MSSSSGVFFDWVCPILGCIMSTMMYGAPAADLRKALQRGRLGSLNPTPWAVMMGNCLGWTAYGCYIRDPFVLASNLPGLVMSLWLNSGAAKLEYHAESNENEIIRSLSPQEKLMLYIVTLWIVILVCINWIFPSRHDATIIGVLVNINLIFFYGAPLQSMRTVLATKSSESIHRPTMIMNWFNTSFWLMYSFAKWNPVIFIPNGIGLGLGIAQGVLCALYPRRPTMDSIDTDPLIPSITINDDEGTGEDGNDQQESELL